MPGFLGLQRFFGNTVGNAAGFAAGGAVTRVLHPQLQSLANEGWQLHPDYPVEPGILANGVAQGQVPYEWAQVEATRTGINKDRFDRLVDIANAGPGIPAAFELWRRGVIDEAGFRRAAKRQGLEQEWINDLAQIFLTVLDPADLARGIHRGLVPDPGLLKGTASPGPGAVESYPVYNVDAIEEALAAGYDRDHLGVLVGLQGNPMGAHEAAQAMFRGVIEENDYLRAIAEGNTRNEWADAIREQSRAIPSVTNYVEARVRGWITPEQMNEGIARHGMTADDGQLEFLIHGRPLSWHQVFIGQRRGGVYDGPTAGIDPPFLKALQESNIRPEWYSIAWAQRYNYPAAFVLRGLTQDHDVSQAEAEKILLYEGWEPELAKTVTTKWAGSSAAAKTDPAIKTAQTKFLTALHKAFVGGAITEAQGVEQLALSGLSADSQTGVLAYWRKEKALEAIKPPAA